MAGLLAIGKDVRALEKAMGDGVKRVYDSEVPIISKLRRVGATTNGSVVQA